MPALTELTDPARQEIFGFYDIENVDELLDQETNQMMDSVMDGFCLQCGSYFGAVEPDARGYHCDNCDQDSAASLVEIFIL